MYVPPPLMWLPRMVDSLSRALDCPITYHINKTVNPLMYSVKMNFGEKPIPKNKALIWNLIQMYAAKNECVIQGKSIFTGTYLAFDIGMKRRMGPPREDDP